MSGATRLRNLRKGLGLTTEALGKLSEIGGRTIRRLEAGGKPQHTTAELLCDAISKAYNLPPRERLRPFHVWPEHFVDPFAPEPPVAQT